MLRSFARSAVRKSTASPSSIATTAVMPSFRQIAVKSPKTGEPPCAFQSGTASGMGHVLGADDFVEFLLSKIAESEGRFAQCEFFVMRLLSDFGGFVVADFWR